MKKYRVCVPFYANAWIEVEAETEEQAKVKGEENVWPSLCHHCSNEIEIGEINDDIPLSAYLIED